MAKEKAAEAATVTVSVTETVFDVPAATQGELGTKYPGVSTRVDTARLAAAIITQALKTGIFKELQLVVGPTDRAIEKERAEGKTITADEARDRMQKAMDDRLALWLTGASGRVRGTEGDPITRKARALIQARLVADAKAGGKVIAPERLKAAVDAALADADVSAPFRADAAAIVAAEQAARAQVKSLTAAATARMLNPAG